jgi:hypothetical protein
LRVRVERRHALARTVAVDVAAGDAEREAVDVVAAGPGDAAAKALIEAREETREAMRTIRDYFARDPTIDARVALACEAWDAITRIVATGSYAKAAADALVALVVGVSAIRIDVAGARPGDEAPREIVATGRKANLADRAGVVVVTERVGVGARRAERAGVATRATVAPVRHATVEPAVRRGTRVGTPAVVHRAVATRIEGERGGSRFSTADRRRSGQHEVSEGTHCPKRAA